jgi:hypothetical protein
MSIQCTIVPVTAYQQNCSIIKCLSTNKAAIVDPGGDVERILGAVENMDATVEKVILTHGHMDHCAASDVLRQQLGIPIEGPGRGDAFWIEGLPQACQMAGFPHTDAFEPDRWLEEGDTVSVGEQTLKVLHCPGHTPGHVVFLYEEQKVAWVGDVLFQGSIGRTDFPQGNQISPSFPATVPPRPSVRNAGATPSWPTPTMVDPDRENLLREEFHKQTARIQWHDLQTNYAHGSVVRVGDSLDLLEVAVQLGLDNTEQFQQWIADGKIAAVSETEAQAWYESNPELWCS